MLHQTDIELSSSDGGTLTECVIVEDNGAFHVDRKVQKLPSRASTRRIEEGEMSADQLARLKQRLQSPELQTLPAWHRPDVPTENNKLHFAELQIARNNTTQDVGYVIWNGTSPASNMDRKMLQQADTAKTVLDPIIGDVDALKGTVLSDPQTAKLNCE